MLDISAGYFVYIFGLSFLFYTAVNRFGAAHLSKEANELLTLWLHGEYESTWADKFCELFDSVFGAKHVTLRCFLRSAFASIVSVCALYVLLFYILETVSPDNRISTNYSFYQILLMSLSLNVLPDYFSLFQTRWILQRFRHDKSILRQLMLLSIDFVLTCGISLIFIFLLLSLTQSQRPSLAEIFGFFSIYSIFFYSSFLTSLWAWLYCISTWFMRVFSTTRLTKFLDTKNKPVRQISLVSSLFLFLFFTFLGPLIQKDRTSALMRVDKIFCDIISVNTCDDVARISESDQLRKDYLVRYCYGNLDDCPYVAYKYRMRGDISISQHLLEKSCELGSMRGCYHLATTLMGDMGVQPDFKRALDLYKQTCASSFFPACNNLGVAYVEGPGPVDKNYETATTLFRKACDGGNLRGCGLLGFMYEVGYGVKREYARSIELYRRGCDGDVVSSCKYLGLMYSRGKGISRDFHKSKELYEKACDGGDMQGCFYLATILEHGRGATDKDRNAAKQLFREACDGGYRSACKNM